jgi:hypothetical protein
MRYKQKVVYTGKRWRKDLNIDDLFLLEEGRHTDNIDEIKLDFSLLFFFF